MAKNINQQLIPYSGLDFTCDRCDNKYYNQIAYSPAYDFKQLEGNSTYCSKCVEEASKEKVKHRVRKKLKILVFHRLKLVKICVLCLSPPSYPLYNFLTLWGG